jgi:hypothetical protein
VFQRRNKRLLRLTSGVNAFLLLATLAASGTTAPAASLERGFRHLYDLNFSQAQEEFSSWQKQRPADPMGYVSEAAGILFAEFDRLGVLEAQFYENDKAFAARKKLSPDPAARDRFNAALDRAEKLGSVQVQKDPRDHNALFAMTMASGLRADYAALIDKHNFQSLKYTKQATAMAEQVLAADPNCYDAYLARGVSRYIIGSMSAPVRWVLRLGGVDGDKQAGISDLKLTADRGHFLAPFARILLAIAYVRDKDKPRARELLASLHQEFPSNQLFLREIERLDTAP